MDTGWDWFTIFCFAGLVTLMLQRSAEDSPRDKMWQYLPPALGLAAANYFGNDGIHWLAAVLIVAAGVYVLKVLNPFAR